MAKKMQKD